MSAATLLGVSLVLGFGSFIQRATGMGLALVASPFLVLLLGNTTGVQTLQVIGLGVCLISAITLWRDIEPMKAATLLASSVVGLIPGTWLARNLPASWLEILIGSLTLVALGLTTLFRGVQLRSGRWAVGVAGAASGFMNVTAGVGGPPMVIYANSTNWAYKEYLATVQLYFAGLNILSLVGRGLPELPTNGWVVAVGSAVLGIVAGNHLSRHLNETLARKAVFIIACAGSAATLIRGVCAL